jgi:hypothetical protein
MSASWVALLRIGVLGAGVVVDVDELAALPSCLLLDGCSVSGVSAAGPHALRTATVRAAAATATLGRARRVLMVAAAP